MPIKFETNAKFIRDIPNRVKLLSKDKNLKNNSKVFFDSTVKNKYSYNFSWLGVPIIQYPQDIMALQEIIFKTKPNKIIETGIARGGSVLFFSSLLCLLDIQSLKINKKKNYKLISIDINIRKEVKNILNNHFLKKYFTLLENSSTAEKTITAISSNINKNDKVMIVLDSNHTEEHVLNELKIYSRFVSKNCYIVVMDTVINDIPEKYNKNKEWNKQNNPKTAIKKFINLKNYKSKFIIDKFYENKILITNCPSGFIKKIK